MNTKIIEIAFAVFVVTGLSCSVILISIKYKLDAAYLRHQKLWMPKSVCYFCLGFWVSLLWCWALHPIIGQSLINSLVIALSSAGFIRKIISDVTI